MSGEIQQANERQLGHGGKRGHPDAELCREKIAFYSYQLQYWQPGGPMSKAAREEVLHWWEFELRLAEKRLVQEVCYSQED